MVQAGHWSQVRDWRWEFFSAEELACRRTGQIFIEDEALDALEALRNMLGKPMIITSAYRSPEHNKAVGGASNSLHLQGIAFDVSMANHDPEHFEECARRCGFTGFGYYPASNFMHIDLGRARQWGKKFPPRNSRFAEDRRVPEKLDKSKTAQTAIVTSGVSAGQVAKEGMEIKEKFEDAQYSWSTGDFVGLAVGVILLLGALYILRRRWIDAGRPKLMDVVRGVL